MQTSIDFSGGPWTLQSFSKDKEVLTANTSYWDKTRIPKIKTVTFVPVTETTKEVQAIKTGQVSAIYPQPAIDNVPQLKDSATLKSIFGVTTQYENLWFNKKPGKPFADKNLRAAFSYAFDRQQLLNDVIKPFDPTVEQLNCAAWVPGVGKWCENTAFAGLKPDPTKVASFMAAAGYAKDSSGIWAKGGKELTINWMENTGNKRRENMQAEFIPLLAKQGFKVVTDNSDADTDVPEAAARRATSTWPCTSRSPARTRRSRRSCPPDRSPARRTRARVRTTPGTRTRRPTSSWRRPTVSSTRPSGPTRSTSSTRSWPPTT